jgi:hypothetical protein
VRDKDTVEALISLAMLSFTGYALADQRQQRGLDPHDPKSERGSARTQPS